MRVFFVALLMCSVVRCVAQQDSYLQGGTARKYNVKRITEYDYSNNDTNSKPINTKIYVYHNNREDSVYTINVAKKVKLSNVDVYNTAGQLVGYNFYDNSGNINAHSVFIYDQKGRRIESDSYYENTISLKVFFKYDNDGKISEQDFYNLKGKLTNRILYVYDDKGLETEETWNNPSETNSMSKHTFQYDDYGNQLQSIIYNKDGEVQLSIDSKYSNYDQYNNWRYRISANYMHTKMQGDISTNTIVKRVIEY
ncbi:MAG: hypothetical protein ACTHNW_06415 [Mucilaginibacter sp.]